MGIRQKVARWFSSQRNRTGHLGELSERTVVVEARSEGDKPYQELVSAESLRFMAP